MRLFFIGSSFSPPNAPCPSLRQLARPSPPLARPISSGSSSGSNYQIVSISASTAGGSRAPPAPRGGQTLPDAAPAQSRVPVCASRGFRRQVLQFGPNFVIRSQCVEVAIEPQCRHDRKYGHRVAPGAPDSTVCTEVRERARTLTNVETYRFFFPRSGSGVEYKRCAGYWRMKSFDFDGGAVNHSSYWCSCRMTTIRFSSPGL